MRRRFFVEEFDGNSASLRGEAAEHLGRVLRAEPGQLYELSDGEHVWLGRIERVALSKRGDSRVEFALVEPLATSDSSVPVELLIALVKFDRFEWCLEKATELGASEIVPLAAARSDKPLIAAATKRRARWEKILLESAQQSRRLRLPKLRMPDDDASPAGTTRAVLSPALAFAKSSAASKVLLSERREASPLREVLRGLVEGAPAGRLTSAAIAIGPEGGWTGDEIAAARAAGFSEASLGENILRTETAVVAALAIFQFVSGDS